MITTTMHNPTLFEDTDNYDIVLNLDSLRKKKKVERKSILISFTQIGSKKMKVKELYIYWCFGVVDWLFRCHSALYLSVTNT